MRESSDHVAPPPRDVPADAEGTAAPAGGFWHKPWAQDLLPFVSSLTLHAGLVLVGVATARAIIHGGPSLLPVEAQTVIPDSNLVTDGPPGGVQFTAAVDGDPFRLDQQDTSADAAADGLAKAASPNVQVSADAGGADGAASAVLSGFNASNMVGGPGTGIGGKNGRGNGDGQGGPLARFGPPGGGAYGPKGPMFGRGGNARRIVFVCDATGTMIQKFALLKQELAAAVNGLKPVQSYNVIFFHDGQRVGAASEAALLPATPDNKRRGFAFMDDFTTSGTTDPMPALRLAFRQGPELVYFLSDGEFNNLRSYQEVIDEIARLNPGRQVKVNTILFDTYDKDAEAAMQKIAAEHGGSYRYVREAELAQ